MSLRSLQNYAEWYYAKYFPSIRVLREKISKKTQDIELTEKVMKAIAPMLIEKNILESRVHEYSTQGKTPYYIRQKLLQKKFDSNVIEEVMVGFENIFEDAETYRKVIQDRCKKAEKK
jgi:SOS response regulatory protein OraA/RecX